ncbi:MAG: hypothetical protein V5A30_06710 [Haloarculaceae archaeon]
MLQKLRRMQRNPMLLLRYVMNNPKKVLLALGVLVAVIAVVLLSFSVDAIPTWSGFLGVAVLPAYAAWLQWGRLALLFRASEMPAGQVSSGVVEVSGTARPAEQGGLVSPDRVNREGEYLAYKRIERIDTDPGHDDEELPFLDKEAGDRDVAAAPLYVEDDTGRVLVDTNNADVRLDWDDTSRGGRRTTKWAALEPGDPVTVYGTAMALDRRNPPGIADSLSDVSDSMRGWDFDELAAGENVVISKSLDRPYLILSDRSGLGLLGRQLAYFLVAGLLTVGLLVVALLGIVGRPVV